MADSMTAMCYMLFATMGQLFFITAGGFLGGVLLRSFFNGGAFFTIGLACIGVALLGLLFFVAEKNKRALFLVAVCLLAFSFGIFRFDSAERWRNNDGMQSVAQEFIVAEGVIVDEPDMRETHTKITVHLERVGEKEVVARGNVLVITEQYPKFSYGDRVRLMGTLVRPQNRPKEVDEPGRSFDYVTFLAKDNIFYEMFYPKMERVGEGEGNPVRAALLSLKQMFLGVIERTLPEPHASLLGGIVFGAKQALGPELLETFRIVGIIHIVVLSGYNMTIVAEALGRVASFAPRMVGVLLSGAGVLSFVIMAGAGATVIRAGVMAFWVLFAGATGRIYDATVGLFIAALGMVLWNPMILVFDASFQLSFLATIGLMYLAPRLEGFFTYIPKSFGFRDFAIATAATQIFVLPMLLYMTGSFSIVAFLVNMLVLFVVPFVMFFGFVAALAGTLSFYIALPFSLVAYVLLESIFQVSNFFAGFSWSAVTLPAFPFWLAILCYLVYGVAIFFLQKRKT